MKNRSVVPLLPGLVFLVARIGTAARFDFYEVGKTPHALSVDGCLNEPAWKTAGVISFVKFRSAEPASPQTRVRILRDDQAFYFGVECEEPLVKDIRAGVTAHDGDVWNDDEIEVYLNPDYPDKAYYMFAVNPRGTKYEDRDGDVSWDGDWEVKTKTYGNGWTVEIAIPFLTIESRPDAKKFWGANICRARRAGGGYDLSYWVNTQSFKAVEEFGCLLFANPTVFLRNSTDLARWKQACASAHALIQSDPEEGKPLEEEFRVITEPLRPATEKVNDGKSVTPSEFAAFFGNIRGAVWKLQELEGLLAIKLLFKRLRNR